MSLNCVLKNTQMTEGLHYFLSKVSQFEMVRCVTVYMLSVISHPETKITVAKGHKSNDSIYNPVFRNGPKRTACWLVKSYSKLWLSLRGKHMLLVFSKQMNTYQFAVVVLAISAILDVVCIRSLLFTK